ncbi:hypothetical protein [Streptomyces sp. NPDC058579]|uniref:hypothetical protein n=1 Tax=Streptomyces sp. NPDC058579 TaxID=3346548 RepID=UPI00365AA8BC
MAVTRTVAPRRRGIWGTRRAKALVRGAATAASATVLALAATACSSGDSGTQVEGLCGPSADSSAGTSLRQVLRTDDFTAQVLRSDDNFVREFKKDLREWPGGENSTSPSFVCKYVPEDGKGHVLLDFAWSPANQPGKQRARESGPFYDLNGATGEVGDQSSGLYVSCALGGELSARSRKAVLRADLSLTVNRGETVDKAREAEQLSFLYYMTRAATEVLGCENKPLTKEPVVKPLTESSTS